MTRISFVIFIILETLLLNCSTESKKKFNEGLKSGNDNSEILQPMWDKPEALIIKEYKERYKASDVRIRSLFYFRSKTDQSYWISVAFLNPDFGDESFSEFARIVAKNTCNHLSNPADFERLEIISTRRSGFIITFSKNENIFFTLDSLRK